MTEHRVSFRRGADLDEILIGIAGIQADFRRATVTEMLLDGADPDHVNDALDRMMAGHAAQRQEIRRLYPGWLAERRAAAASETR